RLRRIGKAAELSNELKRRSADLFLRGRWREVMKRFDVSTHRSSFCSETIRCSTRRCWQSQNDDFQVRSLVRGVFSLLLGQPLVKIGPVIDVEDIVIASRKYRQ